MGLIYGLSCTCHPAAGVRYVGLTSRSLTRRFGEHRKAARAGGQTALYAWMREHEVQARPLQENVADDDLRLAEIRWMARLRGQGRDLLNGTDFWKVVDGIWLEAS